MDILVAYILQFVGMPYRWGGDDTIGGFDCSGVVQEWLSSAGIDPPGDQTAQALYDHFEKRGSWNEYRPGALAFYGKSCLNISHVGMMVDAYRIAEAAGGGSRTNDLAGAERDNAYIRLRPVNYRKDLVAIIYPGYESIGVL